jgi:formylglycine-generating enzyme required for sulfatase activity
MDVEVRYLPPRFTVNLPGGVPMEFVIIQAGTFLMGTDNPDDLADGSGPRPTPMHSITHTSAFYLAKFPTTRAQWWSLVGNDPARVPPNPDFMHHP